MLLLQSYNIQLLVHIYKPQITAIHIYFTHTFDGKSLLLE